MGVEIGTRMVYVKTHEGHHGRITGTVKNTNGELIRVAFLCDCGANLWLKPDDLTIEMEER